VKVKDIWLIYHCYNVNYGLNLKYEVA